MPPWSRPTRTEADPTNRGLAEDNIGTATLATFDTLVTQATGRVAVEFMSYGCVHCRAMEPILQEVAHSISDTETVYRVNIAIDEDLAARYDIEGTPTLVMFMDGREVGRSEGPSPTVSSVMAAVTNPYPTPE